MELTAEPLPHYFIYRTSISYLWFMHGLIPPMHYICEPLKIGDPWSTVCSKSVKIVAMFRPMYQFKSCC